MKKSFCLIALMLGVLSMPAAAQKSKSKAAKETQQPAAKSADQLIREYQFDKAAQVLQKEMAAASRAGKGTERLEAELIRANLGQDMLRGTEKVTFIDSIVVSRQKVLSTLKLSREAGQLMSMSAVLGKLLQPPAVTGESAFVNELADRVVFAATDSVGKGKAIYMAYRTGKNWGTPAPLEGLDDSSADRDYPFMMPDGSTLYFAAQGEESLGGYDIFVTRYNASTRTYLKPENVGMPFNSPANDYLMGIDEVKGLGFFVTDRNQPADSACIYIFIPTSTRDVYELTAANADEVRDAAQIRSIRATQTDEAAVKAALRRMQEAKDADALTDGTAHRYVIDDRTVYTRLADFKSEAARRIAEQADEVAAQVEALEEERDGLALQAAQGQRSSKADARLRQIDEQLPQLKANLRTLAKNMRKAELNR